MRIATTSQNRRDITEHAGRCRKFWVFEIAERRIVGRTLLELPKESSLHDSAPDAPHPLDGIDLLISGGMGDGLRSRMARKGIETIVTSETDPEAAVLQWLSGSLVECATRAHAHGHDLPLSGDGEHDGDCGHCGCGHRAPG